MVKDIQDDLKRLAEPKRAKILSGFFKTGKGEYAEGDIFIGVTVPNTRKIASKYKNADLPTLEKLLMSPIHEERLLSLIILTLQMKKAPEDKMRKIFNLYLKRKAFINNWDLVDLSADKIVGVYLEDKPKDVLVKLARSSSIWDRRIAIISTFHFIKQGEYREALNIAKILHKDKHDLIHKAVGWMLREVGKRCSRETEMKYLATCYKTMPRTMLRYAIEHFSDPERRAYLEGRV